MVTRSPQSSRSLHAPFDESEVAAERRNALGGARESAAQARRGDQVRRPLRPADGDVEAIPHEQEVEAARHIRRTRGRKGHDRDDRFLPLESIDGANADSAESRVDERLSDALHLGVVGRDHDEVGRGERSVWRARGAQRAPERSPRDPHDLVSFLRGIGRVSRMLHGVPDEPRRARAFHHALDRGGMRMQPPLVREFGDHLSELGPHASRLGEEVPRFIGNGAVIAEQPPQRGHVDGLGMRSLGYLR